jgi:aldose 1-epimerase
MADHLTRAVRTPLGRTPRGEDVDLVVLRNSSGTEVRAMTFGGIILSLQTRDRDGRMGDIVLGHAEIAGYFSNAPYFGAIIGRYANRISRATFALDRTRYTLQPNNGIHHLHGGRKGWDQAVWQARLFQDAHGAGVVLSHTSPDGDEGYPGTVTAETTYALTDDDRLVLDYAATTDTPTIVNLTQHTYFNLAAGRSSTVLDHELLIDADWYTPVDAGLIPTGELAEVAGTPFDFRARTRLGARIDAAHEQLYRGRGFDHNFVLNGGATGNTDIEPPLAARVMDPLSGRTLEVLTTEPGVQLYTANFLDGTIAGNQGVKYPRYAGLCLETQHFPDSPNQPHFPSTVLQPGDRYRSRTVWKFGIQD